MYTKPELLQKHHNVKQFDCGNQDLNDYIIKFARQNQKKEMGRTFVTTEKLTGTVAGYYTLVSGSINHEQAPENIKKGLPGHPIPIILIAKLAIDINHQGKGLGKNLLKDALFRIIQVSKDIGIRAVHVHAKDEAAASFYKRYDFIESPLNEFSLFLLMKDLKAMINQG